MFHISLAVTEVSPDIPKQGNTVTLTFWVSHAAIAKVTGGLSLAVLHNSSQAWLLWGRHISRASTVMKHNNKNPN